MQCPTCQGCGRVASTPEQHPWSEWTQMSIQPTYTTLAGDVRSLICPRCLGSGKVWPLVDRNSREQPVRHAEPIRLRPHYDTATQEAIGRINNLKKLARQKRAGTIDETTDAYWRGRAEAFVESRDIIEQTMHTPPAPRTARRV